MKNLLTIWAIVLGLSGCTSYQYFTMSSDLPTSPKGFFSDIDSLSVAYSYLENGLLQLEVENKSKNPIFVDMEKSAIVCQGESHSFNDLRFLSPESATTLRNIYSSLTRNYVSPQSKITEYFSIDGEFLSEITLYSASQIEKTSGGKNYYFSKEEGLNQLMTYLYVGTEDVESKMILNSEFWTSKVYKTLDNPKPSTVDQFRKTRMTGFSQLFMGATVIAAIVISVIYS